MGIKKEKNLSATGLRRRAEEQLKAKTSEAGSSRTDDATLRLVHELEVHQIELEMQNTDLRQAGYELETALERYSDLYEFAPVGFFTLDRNGVISAVNLSGAGLLKGVRSRLIGRRFELFVTDADRHTFTDFLGKVLTCKVKESCEVALQNMGNQTVIVQIEAMATASGEEFRLALIDITGRRHAEDALAGKRRELEEHNSSLELRIVQAVDDARRKDQMLILQDRRALMGEMINNIAHQWCQPLNALGLIVQQLPIFYDSAEFSREFLEENTEKSLALIRHMSQTINVFRDFFKPDKGKITFGVKQVIGHTLSLIEQSFKEHQINIALHSDCEPMVYGYSNEYAQVLMNILMNARDALAGHTVDAARISIHAFTEGSAAVVTIADNAGGIDDETIGRVFDPYFTTKGPDKGTGIGLFMSKTIIERNMGGRLTVRNTGNGAEFRIEV